MAQAIRIGLDIAKSVFQLHGEDAAAQVVLQKRLRRSQVMGFFSKLPPAVIGIEACGSSHYWGRELRALGHEVRLIPAAYVKPFVRRNKTDARDAAAIGAALARPDMRFVAIKSIEQQASRGVERARDLLVKQQTQLTNSVRGQLAEFGIVARQGKRGFAELAALIAAGDERMPPISREALGALTQAIDALAGKIAVLEQHIVATARRHPAMRRLATIPGIGPLTAHAIVTAIGDGRQFASARDFAAWCGLTRRVAQSANTRRQRGISRQGDNAVRKLLTLGASSLLRHRRAYPAAATQWPRTAARPMHR